FNGRHPDGYTPTVLTRWFEFLEFYVARRIPRLSALIRAAAPSVFQDFFHVAGLKFEPDRFPNYTDYSDALAAYEAEPQVRVLFEVGGVPGKVPGAPIARYETSFPSWPPPNAVPQMWYLGSNNALLNHPPAHAPPRRLAPRSASGSHKLQHDGRLRFPLPAVSVQLAAARRWVRVVVSQRAAPCRHRGRRRRWLRGSVVCQRGDRRQRRSHA